MTPNINASVNSHQIFPSMPAKSPLVKPEPNQANLMNEIFTRSIPEIGEKDVVLRKANDKIETFMEEQEKALNKLEDGSTKFIETRKIIKEAGSLRKKQPAPNEINAVDTYSITVEKMILENLETQLQETYLKLLNKSIELFKKIGDKTATVEKMALSKGFKSTTDALDKQKSTMKTAMEIEAYANKLKSYINNLQIFTYTLDEKRIQDFEAAESVAPGG